MHDTAPTQSSTRIKPWRVVPQGLRWSEFILLSENSNNPLRRSRWLFRITPLLDWSNSLLIQCSHTKALRLESFANSFSTTPRICKVLYASIAAYHSVPYYLPCTVMFTPTQAGMHTTPPATRKNLHLNRGRFSLTNLSLRTLIQFPGKREKCDLLRCPETKTNLLRFSIECARLPIQQRDKRTKFCSAVTVSSVKKKH